MQLEHEYTCRVGRRANNEDAVLLMPEQGFFAIADGMGGYEGGEVASRVALDSLRAYCDTREDSWLGDSDMASAQACQVARERLALAIRVANREVKQQSVGRLRRMGTTLACLSFGGGHALIGHVGDSRVYRMRDGELAALTQDHSLLNQLRASGLDVPVSARLRCIVTQALGSSSVDPDLTLERVRAGDRYLLCTDGVSDVLDDRTLAEHLSRGDASAEVLADAAYRAGSQDNITAVIVRVA